MTDEAGFDDRLVSRSEIAELAGVSRENVTMWARRYADFPRPTRSGEVDYFRLAELMSWWENRTIPTRSLQTGEKAGMSYADRVRRARTVKARNVRKNLPAARTSPRDEEDRLLTDAILRAAGHLRSTGSPTDHLHLLMSLTYLRASDPDEWEQLCKWPQRAGGPNEGRALLGRIGLLVDRRLRDRGLLPGIQVALGTLQPTSPDDLVPFLRLSAKLGPSAFGSLMDRYATQLRLGPETSFTPSCVARLMADLLLTGGISGGRVLDPYARGGELLAAIADQYEADTPLKVYGQSADQNSLRLAGMNLALRGLPSRLQHGTPASWEAVAWSGQKLDLIITNPPFNKGELGKRRRGEDWPFGPPPEGNDNFAWIQHSLASLDVGGRAAVVMPNTAGTSTNTRERAIRRALIGRGVVECIVALPSQLFPTTAIPVSVWLLTVPTEPRDQVLFINAQKLGTARKGQRTLAAADHHTIVAAYRSFLKDQRQGRPHRGTEGISVAVETKRFHGPTYSLNPLEHQMAGAQTKSSEATRAEALDVLDELSQHQAQASTAGVDTHALIELLSETRHDDGKLPTGWRRVLLKDICDIQAGPSYSRMGTPKRVQEGVSVVLPKHLRHGRIDATGDERVLWTVAEGLHHFSLAADDIVCVRSGSTGPSALVTTEQDGWLFSTNLLRLRRRNACQVNPYYLLGYLTLPRVQEWIRGRSAATAIASISVQDLGLLEVVLPPLQRQERIGEALSTLDEQILAAQRRIAAVTRARTLLSEHLMGGAAALSVPPDVPTPDHLQKGPLP